MLIQARGAASKPKGPSLGLAAPFDSIAGVAAAVTITTTCLAPDTRASAARETLRRSGAAQGNGDCRSPGAERHAGTYSGRGCLLPDLHTLVVVRNELPHVNLGVLGRDVDHPQLLPQLHRQCFDHLAVGNAVVQVLDNALLALGTDHVVGPIQRQVRIGSLARDTPRIRPTGNAFFGSRLGNRALGI